MLDRDALLRAIAASPEDDWPRLVYAEWCDESGGDRERATAEFVRLTCGLPEPKRAKTKKCKQCAGDLESYLPMDDGTFKPVPCAWCRGTGRVDNPRSYRVYPKAAHEWLLANWRRLVPALAAGWDHERVKLALAQAQAVEATPPAVWGSLAEVVAAVRDGTILPFATWGKRGSLRAGVPFVLPITRVRSEHESRIYTATVDLSFARGFVSDATWKAPSLGAAIAAALLEDQPLARQSGPHMRNWDTWEAGRLRRAIDHVRTTPHVGEAERVEMLKVLQASLDRELARTI